MDRIDQLVDEATKLLEERAERGEKGPVTNEAHIRGELDALAPDEVQQVKDRWEASRIANTPARRVLWQFVSYLVERNTSDVVKDMLRMASVMVPDPNNRNKEKKAGVTAEVASTLADVDGGVIEEIIDLVVAAEKFMVGHGNEYVLREMLLSLGSRAVDPLVDRIQAEEDGSLANHRLLYTLLDIPGVSVDLMFQLLEATDDPGNIQIILDSMITRGLPAVVLLARALEHPNSACANRIVGHLEPDGYGRREGSTEYVAALSRAVIDNLVRRDALPSDTYNDVIVARFLEVAIQRSPTLRPSISAALNDLIFRGSIEQCSRAIKVATRLDRDELVHGVRQNEATDPERAKHVLSLLGIKETSDGPQRSLQAYSQQLEDLQERALQSWDNQTLRSKVDFWLRSAMTAAYFSSTMLLVGVGLYFMVTAPDFATKGIGALVSAVSSYAGLLSRAWQKPVQAMGRSETEHAALEMALTGFMTRIGQIRLMFEQSYAQDSMSIDDLFSLQELMSKAEQQSIGELRLRDEHETRSAGS